MSLKTSRVLPSFEGVAASSTASMRCPIGLTYHQILIDYGGIALGPGPELADIDEIRVVANGQVIVRYNGGTQLNELSGFEGRALQTAANAAGRLTIDFDRYNMRSRAGEEFTALGTGFRGDVNPVRTLVVEVDIGAGATNPTLTGMAVQSAPQPADLIKKVRQFTYNPTAAGDFDIADLPRGDIINRIWFETANVDKLTITRDNFIVFERTDVQNTTLQTDGVRVPDATSRFVYDPTENGNAAEGLVTAGINDLRFTLEMSAGGAVPTIVEYLGPLTS